MKDCENRGTGEICWLEPLYVQNISFKRLNCYDCPPLYHLEYFLMCIISVCFFMSVNAFPGDLSLKYRWLMNPSRSYRNILVPGSYSLVLPVSENWMLSYRKCLMWEESQNLFLTLCFANAHMYIGATDHVQMPPPNIFISQKMIVSTAWGRMKSSSESQTIHEAGWKKVSVLRNSVLKSSFLNTWNTVQILYLLI